MVVFCSSSRVKKSSHTTTSTVTIISKFTTRRSGLPNLVGASDGASSEGWLLRLEEGEKVGKLGKLQMGVMTGYRWEAFLDSP
jgi:hypothetical protein